MSEIGDFLQFLVVFSNFQLFSVVLSNLVGSGLIV